MALNNLVGGEYDEKWKINHRPDVEADILMDAFLVSWSSKITQGKVGSPICLVPPKSCNY